MPYWVQIEHKHEGNVTGCIQIDLEKVDSVTISRVDNKPARLLLGYYQASKQILIDGPKGVNDFLREWESYRDIKFKSEPTLAGNIHVPDSEMPTIMTGKHILRG